MVCEGHCTKRERGSCIHDCLAPTLVLFADMVTCSHRFCWPTANSTALWESLPGEVRTGLPYGSCIGLHWLAAPTKAFDEKDVRLWAVHSYS